MRLNFRLPFYVCGMMLLALNPRLAGQNAPAVTILHNFTGGADGGNPYDPLVLGSHGNFYGTTRSGGSSCSGTVFQFTPEGVFTTLHSFTGIGNDGADPEASLALGAQSDLYGMTWSGGRHGNGTVFRLSK